MSLFKRFQVLWVVALLLSNGACALFRSQPDAKYTTEQLREMGEKFLAAGTLGQALKLLTMAEARTPNDPVIQFDLGRAYEERGMPSQALEHYQKAVTLKPDYSEAQNALGAFYANRGDLNTAEKHFRKALANPFYETPQIVYYNLGLLDERKSNWDGAMENYQEAIRLFPCYGLAHYHLGLVFENLKRADAARESYGRAIECSPDLADAHFRYGVMSYTAGEIEHAIYSLSRVIKLAPHSNMAMESRRYLERLQGVISTGAVRPSSLPASERLTHLEVMANQDMHQPSKTSSASSRKPPVRERVESGPYQKQPPSPGPSAETRSVPSTTTASAGPPVASLEQPPSPEPKVQAEPPSAPPPGTHWTYIVQVGSFLDRENADTLKQRLSTKGYEAVVKPLQHQVLGQVYIVQLKPVNDEAKASTLMVQLEGDEQVKPIIIKVPSNN